MDTAPQTPEDRDDQAWLAGLLAELSTEDAYEIAESLGIDPDTL